LILFLLALLFWWLCSPNKSTKKPVDEGTIAYITTRTSPDAVSPQVAVAPAAHPPAAPVPFQGIIVDNPHYYEDF